MRKRPQDPVTLLGAMAAEGAKSRGLSRADGSADLITLVRSEATRGDLRGDTDRFTATRGEARRGAIRVQGDMETKVRGEKVRGGPF